MGDDLAALRHPANQRCDQPAQGIDILIGFGSGQIDAGLGLEILQLDPRIGNEAVFVTL